MTPKQQRRETRLGVGGRTLWDEINKKEIVLGALACLAFLGVSFTARRWLGEGAWWLILPAMLVVLLAAQLLIYHQQKIFHRRARIYYQQTEALFSLFANLEVRAPLPPMTSWAISPDVAVLLVSLIRERRPRVILEVGSGVSTIVCAYALEAQGEGKIISLEHDAEYAETTVRKLEQHGLSALAEVVSAPLGPVTLNGTTWQWYDTTALDRLSQVDLLIVDGPPATTMAMARYPALPLVFDKLSEGAVVVLDDAERDDEAAVANRWQQEFPVFTSEFLETDKGVVLLRRQRV